MKINQDMIENNIFVCDTEIVIMCDDICIEKTKNIESNKIKKTLVF